MIPTIVALISLIALPILLWVQIKIYIDLIKLSKPSAVKSRIDKEYVNLDRKLPLARGKAVSFAHTASGFLIAAAACFFFQGFSILVSFLIGCSLFASSLAFTAWQAPSLYTSSEAIKRAKKWALFTYYIVLPLLFVVIYSFLAMHTDPQTNLVKIQEINFREVFLIIGAFFMFLSIGKNVFVRMKSMPAHA